MIAFVLGNAYPETVLERAAIEQMSPGEKLEAIQELWDSLTINDASVPSPEWHAEILAARKRRVESGAAKFLTVDELRSRLGR